MENFTIEGQWWLPEVPARRVPGTLTFDADGLELILYDALRKFEMPEDGVVGVVDPKWKVDPIVHGRTRDGRDFTLFDVSGANLVGPFDAVQEVYRPQMALAGCHTWADQFAEAWCSFDYLDAWAAPPAISTASGAGDALQVRLGSIDLGKAEVAGGSLRLASGVQGTSGGEQVQLTRWTSFAVTPTEPRTAKTLIDGYARPLQDLLMFCLGRPVRLTSLRLLPTDLEDRRQGTAKAFFVAVQPTAGRARTVADVESYSAPTILSMPGSPVALNQLLSRWFDLWSQRREVLTLLLAPLYAPFMYGEHGFASTFQSAEALHDLVLPTRDVSKADHRQRVESVVEALESANLDAAVVAWASKVLNSRNDKPLARKIEDLLSTTGSVGDTVLQADPRIGPTTAAARTGVSHGGGEKTLDAVGRYWYGQVLGWVVRARLLMDLLDDQEEAQRRITARASFRHALDMINGGGGRGSDARP